MKSFYDILSFIFQYSCKFFEILLNRFYIVNSFLYINCFKQISILLSNCFKANWNELYSFFGIGIGIELPKNSINSSTQQPGKNIKFDSLKFNKDQASGQEHRNISSNPNCQSCNWMFDINFLINMSENQKFLIPNT
ncbi:hypothetical protein SNEBB_010737 [Seison nebaliae]|nr:hypothetical protein SNEBB_010737 [Seison nebaliae]